MSSPVAIFLISSMQPQFLDAAVTLGGFYAIGMARCQVQRRFRKVVNGEMWGENVCIPEIVSLETLPFFDDPGRD